MKLGSRMSSTACPCSVLSGVASAASTSCAVVSVTIVDPPDRHQFTCQGDPHRLTSVYRSTYCHRLLESVVITVEWVELAGAGARCPRRKVYFPQLIVLGGHGTQP